MYEPVWTGEMWECPDFFPLDGRHVLIMSVHADDPIRFYYSAYVVGDYTNETFTPQTQGYLDLGGHLEAPRRYAATHEPPPSIGMHGGIFYSAQAFLDDQERRILIGWMGEARSLEAQRAAGWAGTLSLPRVLSLRSDGTLGMAPVSELQALCRSHTHLTNLDVTAQTMYDVPVKGDCLEIIAEMVLDDATA